MIAESQHHDKVSSRTLLDLYSSPSYASPGTGVTQREISVLMGLCVLCISSIALIIAKFNLEINSAVKQ